MYICFDNYEKSCISEITVIGELTMKISKEKAFLLIIGIWIAVGLFFLQDMIMSLDNGWEAVSGIFACIEIIYLIIAFRVLNKEFLSLSFLFSLALILFHLGNVIVVGGDLYTPRFIQNLMIYRYGEDMAKPAIIYSIWFVLIFIIGCVFFLNDEKEIEVEENIADIDWIDYSSKYMACKTTGIILILISLLPSLYVLFLMARTRLEMGYAEIYDVDYSFHGIPLGWLTNLLIPGIILLLVGINKRKKLFFGITYLVVFYYAIYMFLSGRRADGFLVIMSVLILRNYFYKVRFRLSTVVLCWIGIVSLTFIAQTRGQGTTISEMVLSFINNIFHFDVLWDLLLELGGTIRSPMLVMEVMNQYPQYRLGLTYLLSPIAAVLNGLRINSSLNEFISFYSFLSSPDNQAIIGTAINNMGGSAIAEWYFNFGKMGIFLVPFLSKGILYVEKKYESLSYNPFLQAFSFYSVYWLLRYTRGFFSEMMWVFLFTLTVSGIMYYIVERGYRQQ